MLALRIGDAGGNLLTPHDGRGDLRPGRRRAATACFAGEGVGSIGAVRPAGEIVTDFSTAAALLRAGAGSVTAQA